MSIFSSGGQSTGRGDWASTWGGEGRREWRIYFLVINSEDTESAGEDAAAVMTIVTSNCALQICVDFFPFCYHNFYHLCDVTNC